MSGVAWSLGADVDDAVAPVGRRLLALLVDQAVAVLVVGAGVLLVLPGLRADGASAGALVLPVGAAAVLAVGQWVAEAFAGCTIGGALLGIRTVSARTGRPAGLRAVLVRSVVQACGGLLAGVGVYLVAASGAWDEAPEQRGWHDRAARTLVLRRAYLRDRGAGAAGPGPTPPVVAPVPTPRVTDPVPATAAAPVVPAAPPAGLPDATIPTVLPEGLERTHLRGDVPTPAPVRTGRGVRLSFDSGEVLDPAGPGLVGRRPVPPPVPLDPAEPGEERDWVHLVAVDDPAQSLSATHLAFWPEGDRLVVTDLGSTNGTVLVDPSGSRWALLPEERVVVVAGWSLVLGQRTVRVEERVEER
jgi:uncharacterized RDD family membrane protein YckC